MTVHHAFREHLTPATIAGGLLIVAGVAVSTSR
jgi:drug/metabolite transporter (DMT)-like permease